MKRNEREDAAIRTFLDEIDYHVKRNNDLLDEISQLKCQLEDANLENLNMKKRIEMLDWKVVKW